MLGGLVAYVLLVAFCLSELRPRGIADDPTVKGKGQNSESLDYALALSSKLAAEGIHGRLIFHRWHIRNTTIEGSHIFLVYRLSDAWIIDDEISHPRRVPSEASAMRLFFLLTSTPSAPVDVELEDGLNHVSYF